MCGICGFIGQSCDFEEYGEVVKLIVDMTESMEHRGPDGSGYWIDMDKKITMGHRRLSIIDLSENGKQPMVSKSERYVISFNGEIYNYKELRKNLETKGVYMQSLCDTEVMLEYIDYYGINKALQDAIGMFGLSIYDRVQNKVYLARDRFGEKSVYYGCNNGRFVFASELKAIKALPFFKPEIDSDSVYLFLKYNYVKAPWSIYKDIKKILPGQMIVIDINSMDVKEQFYYRLEDVIVEGEKSQTDASLKECVDDLEVILSDVIKRQLNADVPVGLFLSSGVDSALTSAIAQKVCGGKLKTYSIGSDDENMNEAILAKEYAKILGTDHHEYYINADDCFDLLLKIPQIYDEPFSQPSAIATYLVSKLAKNDVTVAISGDGGDEMFAGYIRDIRSPLKYKYFLNLESLEKYDDIYDYMQTDMFKTAGFKDELFNGKIDNMRKYKYFGSDKIKNDLNKALYYEALSFMESETLVKVDRASMANSLEVREPFLDPAVARFAFTLPEKYKYDTGHTKVILKELLAKYLPRELFDIKKRGFHFPIHKYIKTQKFNEMFGWAFENKFLEKNEFLNAVEAKRVINEQLSVDGTTPIQSVTFNILILQLWLKHNIG